MTVDLALIYAKVKQRAERDRHLPCGALAETARLAARELMSSQTQSAARKFAEAERVWLNARPRFLEPMGQNFKDAIRSGNFVCNYRTVNNLNTGYDPPIGWIYLVTSTDRPSQVKIGCTTLELRRRLLKIRRLHEPKALLYSARWVRFPARLEALLHSEFRKQRVAGNIAGASTEWFNVNAVEVEIKILRLLAPGCEFWIDELLFSLDPEARRLER